MSDDIESIIAILHLFHCLLFKNEDHCKAIDRIGAFQHTFIC